MCHVYLEVLDWLLGKQDLALALASRQTSLEWRPNDIVEQESAVNEQREADDLEPLERLPAETQRDQPDKEGTGGVDCASRCG